MGQYTFELQFRLHKDGESEYLARSNPSYFMNRSATAELDLEAGQYCLMVKVGGSRNTYAKTPADVVKETCETRRDKLLAVGLSYDLAHAKGGLKESELEHKERVKKERREKRKTRAKKYFEAERASAKRDKLRRLREEAKAKAREKAKEDSSKDEEPKGEPGPGAELAEPTKLDEGGAEPPKLKESGAATDGGKIWTQDLSSKEIKIIIEVTDKTGRGTIEQSSKPDEIKQAEETVEQQVATPPEDGSLEDETKAEGTDTETKPATTEEEGKDSSISTIGVTPSTSTDGKSAIEDGGKSEEQSSTDLTEKEGDAEKAPETVKDIEDQTAAEPGEVAEKSTADKPEESTPELNLDTISDDGLSWSSDIDVPLDSPSESESDSEVDEPAPPPPEAIDGAQPIPSDEPWNAVCVFGLRIYSKGSQAEIEVVRKGDGSESVTHNKLDVDDQAADATKKLQRGNTLDEANLATVGTAPAWEENSKQG